MMESAEEETKRTVLNIPSCLHLDNYNLDNEARSFGAQVSKRRDERFSQTHVPGTRMTYPFQRCPATEAAALKASL